MTGRIEHNGVPVTRVETWANKHKIKITLGTPIIKKRTPPDIANNTHTNDGTNTNDGDFSGVWWYWLFFVRRPRDG